MKALQTSLLYYNALSFTWWSSIYVSILVFYYFIYSKLTSKIVLQVMSIMRMNRYFALATLNLGMHNDLVTAMAMAQGINLMNQTTSPPLIPTPNWPLPPFSNIPFPHTAYQSLFPTTALPASSTQCVCGLAPCFPSFLDFSSRMMGGRQ